MALLQRYAEIVYRCHKECFPSVVQNIGAERLFNRGKLVRLIETAQQLRIQILRPFHDHMVLPTARIRLHRRGDAGRFLLRRQAVKEQQLVRGYGRASTFNLSAIGAVCDLKIIANHFRLSGRRNAAQSECFSHRNSGATGTAMPNCLRRMGRILEVPRTSGLADDTAEMLAGQILRRQVDEIRPHGFPPSFCGDQGRRQACT